MTPFPQKQKILHFMPENHVWGGIETYLKLMLPILEQQGQYEVVAVVTEDSKLFHELKNAGIKVHGIPFPFRERSLLRSILVNPWCRTADLSVYARLLPILKEEKPDLVHIHCGRIEQALIRMAGFPMVYTYHGYGGPYNLENAKNLYLKYLYTAIRPLFSCLVPFLSGMTVVSESERQRIYREKFIPTSFPAVVLHNGIPTQDMLDSVKFADVQNVRESLNLPPNLSPETRLILFACRLRDDRNPRGFIRIAKQVIKSQDRKNPVYFLVAGDGKLADKIEREFAEDPVLAGNGQFLGFRNDIPQLIKACDMTVSTALQEGFGLRILESLLFGKPCVAFAAGGVPEVMALPEAQDWLIPVSDEKHFAEQVLNLVNLDREALNALAPTLQKHAETFDIKYHVEALQQFYGNTFEKLGNQLSQAGEPGSASSTSSYSALRPAVSSAK